MTDHDDDHPAGCAPLVLRAEPFAEPTLIDLPDGVPVVELHHSGVTIADLPRHFDSGFATLATLGPVGPGYAVYLGDLGAAFDLRIGFPVAAVPAELPDGVLATTFPAGRALVLTHSGGFEGLGASWGRLHSGPDAVAATSAIEIYVSDPSITPAAHLRTDIVATLD
ncbi:GyrI-like domain-containing protein [Nocardioides sp. R-C-SC26]|uniref:GyrI-like domain-containing protein n=1 Tax=Nocardioides sp. R-C-SC26 TaxID=2870414 RepID=UPI001E5A6127|nr:GyrI-like domain-containing protein [Nocardioides sp. R-C-SC26]